MESHDDFQGFRSPVSGHIPFFHQALHHYLIPFHQGAPGHHFPDIRRQSLEFFREQVQIIDLDHMAQFGAVPAKEHVV